MFSDRAKLHLINGICAQEHLLEVYLLSKALFRLRRVNSSIHAGHGLFLLMWPNLFNHT